MKKFIVWRWMIPLARLIDKDKDDEGESYIDRGGKLYGLQYLWEKTWNIERFNVGTTIILIQQLL